MARLKAMRQGVEVTVNRRPVQFSYWPKSQHTNHRRPIQSTLFSNDPWLIMKEELKDIEDEEAKIEATSYILQAEDFFNSANRSTTGAAQPLQLYYCYLNLLKAYIKYYEPNEDLSSVQHGINEAIEDEGYEFYDGFVKYWHSPNRREQVQALDRFVELLGCERPPHAQKFAIPGIIPQILPGHRIWAYAAGKNERFISIHSIRFIENKATKKVWLRLNIFADDCTRLGHTQQDLLAKSGLSELFQKVKNTAKINDRGVICFEQKTPLNYTRHGSDKIEELVAILKHHLWTTVGTTPPYRRYYLYLIEREQPSTVVDQLISIYMLTFYLGSITRYRPNAYQSILDGDFGSRITDFISSQSNQFIYLFASEFIGRDISKPSIV